MRLFLRTCFAHLLYGCGAAQYEQGLEATISTEAYIILQRITNKQAALGIGQFIDVFQNFTKQKRRFANYYRLSSCKTFDAFEEIAKS